MGDAFAPGPPPPPEVATQPSAPVAVMAPPPPPETASPATSPQQVPGASAPLPPEDARQRIMALSPDPAQADAKLNASEALGKWLRMNPADVHGNFAPIAEHLFGDSAKGQPPVNILQRIQGNIKNAEISHRLDTIYTKKALGIPTTQTEDVLAEDLPKQQTPAEQTIQGFPSAVVDFLYTYGYRYPSVMLGGIEEEKTASVTTQTAASLGNALVKLIPGGAGMGINIVREANRQAIGGHYRALLDAGVSERDARIGTFVLSGLDNAVNVLPGMGAAKAGAEVAEQGLTRTLLSPQLVKTVIKGSLVQDAYAYGQAIYNVAATNIAKAAEGKPIDSFSDMVQQVIRDGSPGAIMGNVMMGVQVGAAVVGKAHTPAEIVHDAVTQAEEVNARAARFEEAVKAATEKAKAAEVPEHPIEGATREMQAKQTIGDIVDREPQLPEVKPAEDPYAAQLEAETAKKTTVSDEQLKAMLDKAKEAHGEDIKMPGVTKDWHDAVRMDPNDEGKAVLWYNDAEGGTHAIVEPLEAKATERPSTGNGSETTTEPATRPVTPAMSEEQGRVLDKATLSEEGTSDYIERHPGIKLMNDEIRDQVDQVDKLTTQIEDMKQRHGEALDEAQSEKVAALTKLRDQKNARIDELKAAIPAAKKSLRDQMKQRADINKNIATIKGVAKIIKTMNRDLGEAAQALVDKIELKGRTKNADRGGEFLSEMNAVHKAFADALNDPEQASHISPFIDVEKLKGLATVKARDLSPDDLKAVTDALLNLKKAQQERTTIRNAGLVLQMKDLEKKAQGDGVLGLKLKPEEGGSPETAGTGKRDTVGLAIRKALRDAKGAVAQIFSNNFQAFLAFGDEGSDLYKIIEQNPTDAKLREEPHANRLRAPVMEDWVKKNLKIDPKKNTIKWANYLNEKFEEDGITLTKDEIMSAYKDSRNPKNWKSRLSGSGISSSTTPEVFSRPDGSPNIKETTFQKFFAYLDSKEKALLEDLSSRELDKAGDERGTEYENRFGFPMTREPPGTYWPKYPMNVGKTMADSVEEFRNNQRLASTQVGDRHSQERTNYSGPTYLRGFFKTYGEIMDDTAHVVEMGPVIGPAAKALNNPIISDTIKTRRGPAAYRSMVNELKAKSGQDMEETVFDKAAGAISALNTAMNLSNKIKAPIKQAMLGSRSVNMVHPQAFLKALINTALHYQETSKMDKSISMISNTSKRRGGTIEQYRMTAEQGIIGNPALQKLAAIRSTSKRIGMAEVRGGTDVAYTLDGAAAIAHTEMEIERAKAGKPFMSDDFRNATGLDEEQVRLPYKPATETTTQQGLSPEDILKSAGKFSDAIKGQTHAGAAPGYRLGIQKNKIVGAIFQYKTEPFKGTESVARSIIQAYRNPTPWNVGKAIKTTAYYVIVEGAMMYGLDRVYNSLFGGPPTKKDQQDRAAKPGESDSQAAIRYELGKLGGTVLKTDLQQLPGGSVGTALYDSTQGIRGGYSGSAATQLPENILKVFGAIRTVNDLRSNEAQKKKATQDIIDYGWETGLSAILGANITDPVKIARGIKQRLEK